MPNSTNKKEINMYGVSDDYAVLETDKYLFYYGYEQEDEETGEWCFVVRNCETNDTLYTLPQRTLEENGGTELIEPVDYLVVGMAIWLNKQ